MHVHVCVTVKSEAVGGKRTMKEKVSADFSRKFGSTGGGGVERVRGGGREERVVKPRPSAEWKAVHEAYGPIENGSRKDPPLVPIV